MNEFIKSDTFIGKKEKYEFKLGNRGLGYYITVDLKKTNNELIHKIFNKINDEKIVIKKTNNGDLILSFYNNQYSTTININEDWNIINKKLNNALNKKKLFNGNITNDKINNEIFNLIN